MNVDQELAKLEAKKKQLLSLKQEEKDKEAYERGRKEADRLYENAGRASTSPGKRFGNTLGNFVSSIAYCDFWDDERSWSLLHGIADRAVELIQRAK